MSNVFDLNSKDPAVIKAGKSAATIHAADKTLEKQQFEFITGKEPYPYG